MFLFLLCLLGHVLFWYVFVELACIMANSSCYYYSCDRNSHILVNVKALTSTQFQELEVSGDAMVAVRGHWTCFGLLLLFRPLVVIFLAFGLPLFPVH
jgi:hypothetical protein